MFFKRWYLSTRSTRTYLEDIPESSDAIAGFLDGVDLATYRTHLMTRSAVERHLQNLTEAAFRLGRDAERLCPEVNWREIRGLGNVLRHEYDDIDDKVIWQALHGRLPPLAAAVKMALKTLETSPQDPA